MKIEHARTQMLGQQIRAWEVLDDRVLDVLAAVPREAFVPSQYRELAFADTAIPLEFGQSMLPPKLEGRLLQALGLNPLDQVLEIGTGTGFLTACLARLADFVVSIDIHGEFTAGARERLQAQGIENVELLTGDGLTVSLDRQFDAIAVTGSVPALNDHFLKLLNPSGRLFIVVGAAPVMEAQLITRQPGGGLTRDTLFETVLPALENVQQLDAFVF